MEEQIQKGEATEVMDLLEIAQSENDKIKSTDVGVNDNNLFISTRNLKITPIVNQPNVFKCTLTIQLNPFVVEGIQKLTDTSNSVKSLFNNITFREKYKYNGLIPATFEWNIDHKDDISSVFEQMMLLSYFAGLNKHGISTEGIHLHKDREINVTSSFYENFLESRENVTEEDKQPKFHIPSIHD